MLSTKRMISIQRIQQNMLKNRNLIYLRTALFCEANKQKSEDVKSQENAKDKIEFDYEMTKIKILDIINKNLLVLFMKGNPQVPKCNYSKLVVEILRFYGLNNYHSINVLEEKDIREGLKKYSKWPTFPQLFINKEFVGGSDVIKEMHANGTLEELLLKHKIIDKPPMSN